MTHSWGAAFTVTKKSSNTQTVDYEQIHNLPIGSHVGAVSLHWPELKHILMPFLFNAYPSSQAYIASFSRLVPVGVATLPFVGSGNGPQSTKG